MLIVVRISYQCLRVALLILMAALVCVAGNAAAAAGFVGKAACATCHQEQTARWTGSHHDLAMQLVSEQTVLGDFADATSTHYGASSSFYRDGERFMVRTEGAGGKVEDFEIKYVFGIYPRQSNI